MDKKETDQNLNIDKNKTSPEVNLNNADSTEPNENYITPPEKLEQIAAKTPPPEKPEQVDSKIESLTNEKNVSQNNLNNGQTEEFNFYKNKEEARIKEQNLLEVKIVENNTNIREDIDELRKKIAEVKRKKIDAVEKLILFDTETSQRILNKKKQIEESKKKKLHSQQSKIQKHQEDILKKLEKKSNKIEHQRVAAEEHVNKCKITPEGVPLTKYQLKHKYALEAKQDSQEAKKFEQEEKLKEQLKSKEKDQSNPEPISKIKEEAKKESSSESIKND